MTRAMLVLLAGCGGARPAAPVATLGAEAQLVDPASSAPFAPRERYRGRVVVLDFWASWCRQCRETVPQIARLADAFAAQGLVVLGVNEGDRLGDARTAAQAFGIAYPIALDLDLAFADRLGTSALPTLVVVDRDGAIVHRAKHVDAETLAVLRRLLASSGAPPTPPSPPLPLPEPAPSSAPPPP